MSLPPIPQVGPSLVPRNDHLEIAPYAPGEAEEKPVVRVVEMTPTITQHPAKFSTTRVCAGEEGCSHGGDEQQTEAEHEATQCSRQPKSDSF